MDTAAPQGREVTQADIELVLEAMLRREIGSLKLVTWIAEVVGWAACAGAFLFAAVQWGELDGYYGRFDGQDIERWRTFVGLLFPTMLNLLTAGLVLVVLGRGARLLNLHLAARRRINVTGLTLGERIDEIDLEEAEGA